MLEIAVDDPEGLAAAVAAGADRIELCAALELGGLTPAPGLMAQAARVGVPVLAMVRPRPGGFIYSEQELAAMEDDIAAIRAAGLAGVVLGVTDAAGWPDADAIARLRAAAGPLEMVMHRAFDLAPEPLVALDRARAMGFARVMTSGGAARAEDGAEVLARLVARAAGRIGVMAGGQVEPPAIPALRRAGITQFHAACRVERAEPQPMGPLRIAARRMHTDAAGVAALRAAIG